MGEKEPARAEPQSQEGIGEEDKAGEMTIDEYHREFRYCAVCGALDTIVHHIIPKGMGGSKVRDAKNNWVVLCNPHHLAAHWLRQPYLTKEFLFQMKAKVEKERRENYVFGGVN